MIPIIANQEYQKIFKARLLLPILYLIALVVCGSDDRRLVAVIAQTKITRIDIIYKKAVLEAYGDTTVTEAAAMVALINDILETDVAKMNGITPTSEDISALDEHARKTSKAPDILVKIKQIFSRDTPFDEAYERIYLKPYIINHKLHAWYSQDTVIHKKERSRIEHAYRIAISGMSFKTVARACTLEYSVDTYSAVRSQIPSMLKNSTPAIDSMENDLMLKIFASLKAGEMCRNIIEDDQEYKIIKLVGREDSLYSYQCVAAKKRDFDEWFREQGSKIPLRILDSGLRNKILKDYPELWWVKIIRE